MTAEGTTRSGGRQERAEAILTPANVLSLSRIPLAAAFAALPSARVRLVILLAAAASDLLDGWVARRFGGPSLLGAKVDPVADKVF